MTIKTIRLKKGLDLPISGTVKTQEVEEATSKHVAVLGLDYVDLRPKMHVEVGSRVKIGDVLFTDKKNPGVNFTAVGNGEVVAVNRGHKRVLQSVVIKVENNEGYKEFASYSDDQLIKLDAEVIAQQLQESGLWTALRTRPYGKVPTVKYQNQALFFV